MEGRGFEVKFLKKLKMFDVSQSGYIMLSETLFVCLR